MGVCDVMLFVEEKTFSIGIVLYAFAIVLSMFLLHANIERNEMGLNEVSKLLFLLGFEMGMILDSFHMCGMMLVLKTNVYSYMK